MMYPYFMTPRSTELRVYALWSQDNNIFEDLDTAGAGKFILF